MTEAENQEAKEQGENNPDEQFVAAMLPWWRKAAPVTLLTTIISVTVPLTTAVWGQLQKDRELATQVLRQTHESEMEELKLKHEIEMDYLRHVTDNRERLVTLRMIESTNTDARVVAWARHEKEIVDANVKEIDMARAEAEKEAAAAWAREREAEGRVEALATRAASLSRTVGELRTDSTHRAETRTKCLADFEQCARSIPAASCKEALVQCLDERPATVAIDRRRVVIQNTPIEMNEEAAKKLREVLAAQLSEDRAKLDAQIDRSDADLKKVNNEMDALRKKLNGVLNAPH